MRFPVVVLTCVVLGGCAGEPGNSNRANTVGNGGRAGQSDSAGPPSDTITSDRGPSGKLTIALENSGPDATFVVVGLPQEDVARLNRSDLGLSEWNVIFSVHV